MSMGIDEAEDMDFEGPVTHHVALNEVNAAVTLGVGAEMALRRDVITNARMPKLNSAYAAKINKLPLVV